VRYRCKEKIGHARSILFQASLRLGRLSRIPPKNLERIAEYSDDLEREKRLARTSRGVSIKYRYEGKYKRGGKRCQTYEILSFWGGIYRLLIKDANEAFRFNTDPRGKRRMKEKT